MTPAQLVKSYLIERDPTISRIYPFHHHSIGLVDHKIMFLAAPCRYVNIYIGQAGILFWHDVNATFEKQTVIPYADPEFKTKLDDIVTK